MDNTDEPLPPNSMMNFNQFNQRIANENEPNVFYRMPPYTSAPSNVMQSSAPIMMGAAPPSSRGPPRFNANSNPGKKIVHHFFKIENMLKFKKKKEKNAKIQKKGKKEEKKKMKKICTVLMNLFSPPSETGNFSMHRINFGPPPPPPPLPSQNQRPRFMCSLKRAWLPAAAAAIGSILDLPEIKPHWIPHWISFELNTDRFIMSFFQMICPKRHEENYVYFTDAFFLSCLLIF